MKLNKFANLLVLGSILTAVVTGCPKRPDDLNKIHGYRPENFNNANGTDIGLTNPPPADSQNVFPIAPPESFNMVEDESALKDYTVHFAFDSSAIKGGEKSKVASVADFLKSHAADKVRVQGHCDERGTAEYNRSLGERRALALREELVRLGIDPARVDTVSFGFDRPEDPGHNEAAWAKNRRGVFVLLTPPAASPTTAPK